MIKRGNNEYCKKSKSKAKKFFLSLKNNVKNVHIKDYGNAYLLLNKNSVQGSGDLLLSPNAINSKETMKLRIDQEASLVIDHTVKFYTNTNIHVGKKAKLLIGGGPYINEGTKIPVKTYCSIGKNCAISNDVTILDSDFHKIIGDEKQDIGVEIGDHVWIGANASILKNVKIGNGCIIGASSVVLHDIPENCIAVGDPARVIRQDVHWE